MEISKIYELMGDMSLKEKIGQMVQIPGQFYVDDPASLVTGPMQELGLNQEDLALAGSILGSYGADTVKKIQDAYMANHPHHIPLLIMLDVIHGMYTTFPQPLAQAAAFAPSLTEEIASLCAEEAAAAGVHVTFAPMADLVRDARWGRVMEAAGEDPYLGGELAAASVKGFQGENIGKGGGLAINDKLCTCVKHFACYGGAEAGRDYTNVEITEHTFRDFYVQAYKKAIEAGAGMVMTSFNTIGGVPCTGNEKLMRDVLRGELGFDGVLISDYGAVQELVYHGFAADEDEAAELALKAGVDIDMVSSIYARHLENLVRVGRIDEKQIDEAVFRILKLKNDLGLFENPYAGADAARNEMFIQNEEHRAKAREAAEQTFVLLKNDDVLPLSVAEKVAFIGPYVDSIETLANWAVYREPNGRISVREAAEQYLEREGAGAALFAPGCPMLGKGEIPRGYGYEVPQLSVLERAIMEQDALEAARQADVVVFLMGEAACMSGEAGSRANIGVPESQLRLFRKVREVNPRIVSVVYSGRPLDLREVSALSESVLAVWFPGTSGAEAVVNVLYGETAPQGKLPMSFPYSVGQCPVYYNQYSTGRPYVPGVVERFKSRYIDVPNKPLYPFGFGLTYTNFGFSEVEVKEDGDGFTASTVVTNLGIREGTETVQLYIRDVAASVARPVKELKGFAKVTLTAGESREVTFRITEDMLRFTRRDGTYGSEPGKFLVYLGNSSETVNCAEFTLG